MPKSPPTRLSLLIRIRDYGDQDAWRQFVQMYAPVVYGYARKRGLQDADAADLTQEVLRGVTASAGKLDYDPGRGSFRGWLFTLAHHRLYDFLERKRRQAQGSGDTAAQVLLDEKPAREEDAALWDQEYQRRLFARAANQIRGDFKDSTWQAFWQTAVEGKSGQEVAQRLKITIAAVYLAKSRVMARLKERIREMEDE